MNEIINYIDSEFINHLNQISPIVKISLVVVFSLIIGSFLNVIIIRTPLESNLQEKEYVRDKYNVEITDTHHFLKNKRSACPTCSTQLKWYHNIPLFSYLALRGECHSCKTKIPHLYPITEASIAIINILVFFYVFGMNFSFLFFMTVTTTTITYVICAIDLKHKEIYDKHNLSYFLSFTTLFYIVSSSAGYEFAELFMMAISIFVVFWLFLSSYSAIRGVISGEKIILVGAGDIPLFFTTALVSAMLMTGTGVISLLNYLYLILAIYVTTYMIRSVNTKKFNDLAVPAGLALTIPAVIVTIFTELIN